MIKSFLPCLLLLSTHALFAMDFPYPERNERPEPTSDEIINCLSAMPQTLSAAEQVQQIGRCLFANAHMRVAAAHLLNSMSLHAQSTTNPFRGKPGPRTQRMFGFHQHPIAFAVNEQLDEGVVDLVIVNWRAAVPDFFEPLITFNEQPCYLVRELPFAQLFSSPTSFMGQFGRMWQPTGTPLVCERLNTMWKMMSTPSEKFSGIMHFKDILIFRSYLSPTSLDAAVFFLHETYHCHEGRDLKDQDHSTMICNPEIELREIAKAVAAYFSSTEQQNYLYAYWLLVLRITDPDVAPEALRRDLVLLSTLIARLKEKNPLLWQKFLYYEYAEGGAEFVAIQTLMDARAFGYREIHEFEKRYVGAMFYQTGSLGMAKLVAEHGGYEWASSPTIPETGIWEIILEHEGVHALDDSGLNAFLLELADEAAVKAASEKMRSYLNSTDFIREVRQVQAPMELPSGFAPFKSALNDNCVVQ